MYICLSSASSICPHLKGTPTMVFVNSSGYFKYFNFEEISSMLEKLRSFQT